MFVCLLSCPMVCQSPPGACPSASTTTWGGVSVPLLVASAIVVFTFVASKVASSGIMSIRIAPSIRGSD